MANARRIERIENLIREVAAGILAREFQLGGETLVTVTRVLVSEDLYYATIFISAFGDEAGALRELKRMTGLVQRKLNRTLRMRPVPRIAFAIDENEKRRERIEKLLSRDEGGD